MTERSCGACLYYSLPSGSDTCAPCRSKIGWPNWVSAKAEVKDIPPCTTQELADEPIYDALANAAGIKPYIADEAKRIVDGARRGAYGTPEDNFTRIARFWTAYFQNTGRDVEIVAADVSPMMRLMKEARLCETPDHLDSHIDLVGYTLTGAEVNGVKVPGHG